MNVTVENLAPCKKLMRVEIEAKKVDDTFDSITREFQKEAAFPGFRPGKAPRDLVLRKYSKDIETEVKKKLISDSYRQAVEEQKLDVLGSPDIEEIQFARGQPLQFAATIETAPDFQLPEYKGLPVKREQRVVSTEDMDRALDALRQQQVSYKTVERPAQSGDIVVVNYTGTCEGKPVTDLAPDAKGLAEQKNFWVELEGQSFIPGFAEQLAGVKAGERRSVQVDFPADFVTPQVAGKKGAYDVEVLEVKEKILPVMDDAFAKTYGAESLEKLREGVRRDLENELKYTQERQTRMQLMRALLDRVHFELPESAVAQETRNVVFDIVRDNQKRGLSREMIEQHKEQIYTAATRGAKERVKEAFLLQKIAEKENIKATREELIGRINSLASLYQIPADKFLKDLQKRNGLAEIYDQVMAQKVMSFLEQNAVVEEVPAGSLTPGSAPV